MNINYKRVLSPIVKGEVPSYRAVVVNNGYITEDALMRAIAVDCGLKPVVVRSVIDLFLDHIAGGFGNGMRINLKQLDGGLSIRGTAEGCDMKWNESDLELVGYLNVKGALKHPFTDAEPVNVTDAATVTIRRVLDANYETDGWITGTENVAVLASGSGLKVDPEAEDEGCWLADRTTHRVLVKGIVTASSTTTLDVTFPTLPADGRYWFVVASRGGLGADYGVSIGRKRVTVKTVAPEA